jgi:L-ascorbate metabolism protein UlaG (beta-lactamase superfamily)
MTAAEPPMPVAVRFWGQGLVTLETHRSLRIAIDPYATRIGYDNPKIEADLVLVTHEHFDHNNDGLIGGSPRVERGLDATGNVRSIDLEFSREPEGPSVRVKSIASTHDEESGARRGANAMFLVEVDGLRVLHCGDLGQAKLTTQQVDAIGAVDILLIPVGGVYTVDGKQAARITERLRPRVVVPIHYKTKRLTIELDTVEPFLSALDERFHRVHAVGNTLAVTAGRGPSTETPRVVVLRTAPWVMPVELAGLFADKEQACREAQAVFSPLDVDQMNHRPANGTHTPRWNAEHMMGRELGFFSAIYSSIDPAIGPIDLNPAQMPADYVAAHPDWSGAEEARQLEWVTLFTRRFAYLLDGLELDEKPEGSWWTLRGLLEQMQRHYGEHTANVRKKFELPDWPRRGR